MTYDAATCAGQRAVMVWGTLGDWGAYVGDVGAGCDLGNSGSGSFDFPGTNAWFNLIWVNPDDAAGHPGYATPGPRPLTAAGLCSITTDDPSDPTCD